MLLTWFIIIPKLRGGNQNIYASAIIKSTSLKYHIGAPQCTERFDSRNGHTVSNNSDSMNT